MKCILLFQETLRKLEYINDVLKAKQFFNQLIKI